MLQNGNEAGKLTPVTRLWSWKKSSISIVTSLEGDGSKLLMRCASPNVRSKSGSRTVAWSGRKKTSPNLMAVMALMTRRRVPSEPPRQVITIPCRPEWTTPKLLSYKLSSCNFNQVSLNAQSFKIPLHMVPLASPGLKPTTSLHTQSPELALICCGKYRERAKSEESNLIRKKILRQVSMNEIRIDKLAFTFKEMTITMSLLHTTSFSSSKNSALFS